MNQTNTNAQSNNKITREDVIKYLGTKDKYDDVVVNDVLRILNDGYRYNDRGLTEEYRIPEDISTGIAKRYFGVDAYAK